MNGSIRDYLINIYDKLSHKSTLLNGIALFRYLIKKEFNTSEKCNFIILDEPTNHIDIFTKESLEEALKEFKGTLLFVSHDRYFINKLANKVLHINNKHITEYCGNYNYFIDHKIDK